MEVEDILVADMTHVEAEAAYGKQTAEMKATTDVLREKLLAPINPRGCKDKLSDARGIDKIDHYGVPRCIAGVTE